MMRCQSCCIVTFYTLYPRKNPLCLVDLDYQSGLCAGECKSPHTADCKSVLRGSYKSVLQILIHHHFSGGGLSALLHVDDVHSRG